MPFPSVYPAYLVRYCFGFLLLMTYSVLGWCGEMVYCSILQRRLCEKRGFLNGPVCPIYGHGALVVLFCLKGGCRNPVLTFFLGMILTSILEYATSFAMEKLFHMRWWDYSHYRFHINGRICLLNSTLFGLACVFLCHFANPPITAWLAGLLTAGVGVPLAVSLTIVYLADIVLSVRSAVRIGSRLARLHAIHEELSRKLEELKLEHRQAAEAHHQHLEARLAAARQAAEEKLHELYARQDFFERRLLQSFPTLRSHRHPEALAKLREHMASRRKAFHK